MNPNPTIYIAQHSDTAAGRASFRDTPKYHLVVRSVFPTVQGEGPFAGEYAYFIRLGGCNYGPKTSHCQFCDTDFDLAKSEVQSFGHLWSSWTSANCSLVVITGGEPTLQPQVVDLCKAYPCTHFQFETNGTQTDVIEALLDLPNVTVVISPKYSRSGALITPTQKMLDLAVFKFLISANPNDFEYGLPEFAFQTTQPVYLSPIAVYVKPYDGEIVSAWSSEHINPELTSLNYSRAAMLVQTLSATAKSRKLRLSIQQHLFTSIP